MRPIGDTGDVTHTFLIFVTSGQVLVLTANTGCS
jgi:hypothetical protein